MLYTILIYHFNYSIVLKIKMQTIGHSLLLGSYTDSKHDYEYIDETAFGRFLRMFTNLTFDFPYVNLMTEFLIITYFSLFLVLKYGLSVPTDLNNYIVAHGDMSDKWSAYAFASGSTFNSYVDLLQKNIPYPEQMILDQIGVIIYEVDDGDILTLPRIQEMWKFERELHDIPGYEDVCFKLRRDNLPNFLRQILNMVIASNDAGIGLIEENGCIDFRSFPTELRKIMIREFNISNPTADDLTQEHLDYLLESEYLRMKYTYMGSDVNGTKTSRLRCLITNGTPVKGYRNKKDRVSEQRKKMGEWQSKLIKPTEKFLKNKPLGLKAYPNFPYTLDAQVGPVVLTQIPLFAGVFVATIVIMGVYTKSLFITAFGFIGCLFPIPCTLCSIVHLLGIESLDLLDFCVLLFIPVFETCYVLRMSKIYEESSFQFPFENKRSRLLHTLRETFSTIIVSILVTTAGSLASLVCNFKSTVFYGICLALFQMYTMMFVLLHFFTILALYSRFVEKASLSRDQMNHNDSLTVLDSTTIDTGGFQVKRFSLFDFLTSTPPFKENHAMLNVDRLNKIQKFVLNYLSPLLFQYRLVGSIIFLIVTVLFACYGLNIDYKTDSVFFKGNNSFQRGLDLTAHGFFTWIFDFSFVYVWGIKPSLKRRFSYWNNYRKVGDHEYYDINISSESCQQFILKVWDDFLDPNNNLTDKFLAENVGGSPFTLLKAITDFNYTIYFPYNFSFTVNSSTIDSFLSILSQITGFDVSDLTIPDSLPMSPEMFEKSETKHIWRLLTSAYIYSEADGYVPGSLRQNTIGFDDVTMDMKYLAFKGNYVSMDMSEYSYDTLSNLKRQSEDFAQYINYMASQNCTELHDKGYFTSSALLQLEVWDNILYELLLVGFLSILFSTLAYFLLTFSLKTAFMYSIIVLSGFFNILGIVHFAKHQYNINTQAVISLFLPFIGQLYLQPIIRIKNNDDKKLGSYGQIQLSIVQMVVEMSLLCILSTITGSIMFFSQVIIFTPVSLILLSGILAYVQGLFVSPFLYTLFFPESYALGNSNQNAASSVGS